MLFTYCPPGSSMCTPPTGGYFDFDGSNDKITLPNTALSTFDVANRTMSMWFWTDNRTSGTQVAFTIKGADLDYGLINVEPLGLTLYRQSHKLAGMGGGSDTVARVPRGGQDIR